MKSGLDYDLSLGLDRRRFFQSLYGIIWKKKPYTLHGVV